MADPAKGKPMLIKRITAPKPAHLLADQLREAILRGEIAEGASLPSERELVTQTGLTRGSVREALRTLVVEGLVQTRPGRFGGNVVTIPGEESMANSLSQFVRGRQIPIQALHETREFLEPTLARLAALHRTEEDLVELKQLHQELIDSAGSFRDFVTANLEWHNAVARASHNELLSAVLYSLSYGLEVATTTEDYNTLETRNKVILIHQRITEAIEAGDPDLAERRMRRHISASHEQASTQTTASIPLSED